MRIGNGLSFRKDLLYKSCDRGKNEKTNGGCKLINLTYAQIIPGEKRRCKGCFYGS